MVVWTVGHGTRPVEELVSMVCAAGVGTLVDVRRFPGSRHNPQFNGPSLRAVLEENRVGYRHAVELGGRLSGEPGEERFSCLRVRRRVSQLRRPHGHGGLAGGIGSGARGAGRLLHVLGDTLVALPPALDR
jgi:hypothetical protein